MHQRFWVLGDLTLKSRLFLECSRAGPEISGAAASPEASHDRRRARFKVVKDLGAHDEVLALSATLPIALGAFGAAVRMYPRRDD